MYVVPDNYLVSQVCLEAKRLGIQVAYDQYDISGACIKKGEEDYFFTNGKAILIMNIHKLVNGKSVFGLRSNSGNVKIGSIIIDDVHDLLSFTDSGFKLMDFDGVKYYALKNKEITFTARNGGSDCG